MHVIAIHTISDPQKFWSTAEQAEGEMPQGTSLHSAIPNRDGSRAVCVWESDSVDTVRDFVDRLVGDVSENEFFEADAQNARGLPGARAGATA
jgi:hypothetical protein